MSLDLDAILRRYDAAVPGPYPWRDDVRVLLAEVERLRSILDKWSPTISEHDATMAYRRMLERDNLRLRAMLRRIMAEVGTSTRAYHIARDALEGKEGPA